jgi:hypothetical protein
MWLPTLSKINKILLSDLNFKKCSNQSRNKSSLIHCFQEAVHLQTLAFSLSPEKMVTGGTQFPAALKHANTVIFLLLSMLVSEATSWFHFALTIFGGGKHDSAIL